MLNRLWCLPLCNYMLAGPKMPALEGALLSWHKPVRKPRVGAPEIDPWADCTSSGGRSRGMNGLWAAAFMLSAIGLGAAAGLLPPHLGGRGGAPSAWVEPLLGPEVSGKTKRGQMVTNRQCCPARLCGSPAWVRAR